MKQKPLIAVLIIVGMLIFAGCGNSGNNANQESESDSAESAAVGAVESESPAEPDFSGVTLSVGDIQWKEDASLFESAGVADTPYTLDVSVFEGGNASVEAVNAGKIDVTRISEIPPLFAAQADNGANFTIVALLNDHITTVNQEVLVAPGSDIKSIADLKGKTVGFVKATTAHYFLYKFLEEAGLSWDDITPVEVTPSDGPTALLAGSIDAYAGFGGGVNVAKSKGAVTLAAGADILSGYFPYVVPKSLLEDETRRAALFDFLGRMNAAYHWIDENPNDWAKASAEPTGLTEEENLNVIETGLSRVSPSVIAPSEKTSASMQDIADTFYSIGLLEKQVDAASLFSTDYIDELEAAIARYAK